MISGLQLELPLEEGAESPAATWDREAGKRALDDLFSHTLQFRRGQDFRELMDFVRRFRFYAPFNAMLVHIQMPGATYVAPAHRWVNEFGRRVCAGAHPLVILQPMGPVMFVFDVSETEPTEEAVPLPQEVERPFEILPPPRPIDFGQFVDNAKRDGVRVREVPQGSQAAGFLRRVEDGVQASQTFRVGKAKNGDTDR